MGFYRTNTPMVLIKSSFLILIILFTNVVIGKESSSHRLHNLVSQKKYLEVIALVNRALKKNSINPKNLSNDIEYSETSQILLYFHLKSMLLAIKAKQVSLSKAKLKRMQNLFEISDDFDLDADKYDFDLLLEAFEAESLSWSQSQFNFNYFASITYLTWNYSLSITDSTGESTALYSKERGPCLGGGIRYQSALWGFESGLCYAFISATVGEDSKNVKYNQSKVPVDALISTTSIIWRPADSVAIKFGMPIIYHNGDYTPPAGGSLSDTNEFSYGYLIAQEWSVKKMAFEISYGNIKSYQSSFWGLKLIYNL